MTIGIFIYDFGGVNDSSSKCLIQSDGKIVLIGSASTNFAAVRLNSLGGIDTSFGTNGALAIDYGGNDVALSGAIQTDGKIILSGSYAWGTTSSDFALARLLTNGTLDSSFGTNGKVIINFSQYDTADSIALQSDGKILIGGHTYYSSNDDFIAIRLDTNGVLDNTFSADGITNTDLGSRDMGYSITSLPNQSVLLVGESGWGVGIVKYSLDGQLDNTFGQGGKVVLSNFSHSDVIKVVTATDGKIFIGSDTNSGSNRDFSIIRLNSNGSIDTTFANQGRASFDFNGKNDYLSDLILLPDGKIYLTGSSTGDFSALRLNANGSLDTTFGTNGQVITDLGGSDDTSYSAAIQNDGKLVLAGKSNGNFAVIRYNQSGVLDQSFANPAATYALSPTNSSNVPWFNEGSTATFTLTTTNLPTGAVVPYSLSGINSADLAEGTLTGNAIINSNGAATISVFLTNDSITEGIETLTVTVGEVSSIAWINDTSRASNPVSLISNGHYYESKSGAQYTNSDLLGNAVSVASSSSYRGLHGYLATITSAEENNLITNLMYGEQSAFIGASDNESSGVWKWITGPEAGTQVGAGGGYANWYPGEPSNNGFGTSGPSSEDALAISPSSKWLGRWWDTADFYRTDVISADIIVEYGGLPSTYQITSSVNSINEGNKVSFRVSTINVEWDSFINYTITGISSADLVMGRLNGTAQVVQNGIDGMAVIELEIAADTLTEGPETLVLTVNNISSSVVINDTSLSTGITISSTGATPTFNSSNGHYYEFVPGTVSWNQALTSSRVASFNGLQGYLATITSLEENQFIGAMIGPDGDGYNISGLNDPSLNGYFWIGGSDRLLEGDWRWVDGPEAGQKFSTENQKMNGQFSNWFSIPTSVGEGVPNQAARDEDGLALDRSWNYTWYDLPIEDTNFPYGYGVKGYVVEYGGVIKDISLTPSNASVNEGATITFTATTANVASGTIISYTLSGVSSYDVFGGVLSGNVAIDSGGVAKISVTLVNDLLTEGSETLTVSMGGASTSTVINDASQTPSTFIQQVNVENANTYWSYWYVNPTNWSNWGSPRITLTSTLTGNTPLKITAVGSINTDPYVHANDGQLYPGITNAAGIYVAGTSNGYNPGTTISVPLNLPNGTLLNTSASWGALLIGNPEIGWTSVFNANLDNGLGSTNPPTNLSISTSLNTLIGRTLPLGTVLFLTYNDQDNSNTGSYTVSLLDATNNSTLSLVSLVASVNEGSAATFTLITNLTSGTSVPYTLSGISAADVSGGLLSGNAVVNSSGVATISVTLLNDSLTEGFETLIITAGGASASTTVNDTSRAPTYALTASSTSVNEGATVTFTLTTANVANGTTVPYTLSGVSNADVSGGSLSGNMVVDANGLATISVVLVNDVLTEGAETLTVTAAGSTASTTVNDTSRTPTYALAASSSSVNEGSTVTFTLTTANVASGTYIPYTLSGINSADVTGGSLQGYVLIDSAGLGVISVGFLNDELTEGPETLTVSAASATTSSLVNDTSRSPNYSLSVSSTAVNEGSSVTFTLTTINVATGTSVPYTLSGVSTSDISGGLLSGNTVVNSSGVATISVTLTNDVLTEGAETLTVVAGGASASTTVNDTSRAPTYALSASSASVDEGATVTFSLTTANLASGTSVPYTLSGVNSADVSGGSLSGNAVVNSSGLATISVTLVNDVQNEGAETLTITAGGTSTSTTVNDSSRAPTYGLAASSTSVNEGSTVTFTLTTANVASGTSIPYILSGVNTADVSGGALSGNLVVNAKGLASVSVTLVTDVLTEGAETLTITVSGASASSTVNDTSRAPTYTLAASSASVDEGATVAFTLTTVNVATGTSFPYTLSGVSNADVLGDVLSGSTVINSSGMATISVSLLNDALTEGAETLTFTAAGASASTTVNDTSRAPTYTLAASSASVDEGATATFTLSTTNVAIGTSVPYILSGVSNADVLGGSLIGSVVIDSSGQGKILVELLNDSFSEGSEILTVNAKSATSSSIVNDTSRSLFYSLSVTSPAVNEGSSVTFTLTTTNVASGTVIPYTLSGISAADVSNGSLNGSLVLNSSGIASFSITLLNDAITEGSETISANTTGASISTVVNDTSKETPTYSLLANASVVDEGSVASFVLSTTGILAGTAVPYTIYGVSNADIADGKLLGSAIVDEKGQAQISIPIAADKLKEGSETLAIKVEKANAFVIIADTSALTDNYLPSASNVTSTATGSINYYYTSSVADLVVGTPSVDIVKEYSNYASNEVSKLKDGSWQVKDKLNTANTDILKEIDRIEFQDLSLALDIDGPAGMVAKILRSVFGTSALTNTTYAGIGLAYLDDGMSYKDLCALAANAASLTNADLLLSTLLLNVTGSPAFTNVKAPYLKLLDEGVSIADIVNKIADLPANSLNGKLIDISNFGLPYTPYTLPSGPRFNLTAHKSKINEGETASFTLIGKNVPIGESVNYILSGVNSKDIENGLMTNSVTLNSNGVAVIEISLLNDETTEGTEILTVTVGGVNTTTIVNDTSKAPAYSLSASSALVSEGATVVFTLKTSNVAAGTAVAYSLSGISPRDLADGLMSGTAVVNASGIATISIGLVNDFLTEGNETLTINVKGMTSAVTIFDTSKSPSTASASLTFLPLSNSVNEGEVAKIFVASTGIPPGTFLKYSISGVSSQDVLGDLSQFIAIDASGKATIEVATILDAELEDPETMYISIGDYSTSIVIYDLSVNLVGLQENSELILGY
jgi:uncharacterized delta-60 repeat protein